MFKAFRKRIGIIGFGNMGAAIAQRIKNNYRVSVFDKDKEKTKNLIGIEVTNSIAELVKHSDALMLAVKPQDSGAVLGEIRDFIEAKLVISIAAGIATDDIEKELAQIRVIRAMPNLPAMFGEGVSCLCRGKFAAGKDLNFALKLFSYLGKAIVINESMMDAATAVSGSGPGFFFYGIENKPKSEWRRYGSNVFVPEFTAAAESVGFSKKDARFLACRVIEGSLLTVDVTGMLPSELKLKVASRGGTTEAGIEVLSKGGSLTDAVKAALRRAQELSK